MLIVPSQRAPQLLEAWVRLRQIDFLKEFHFLFFFFLLRKLFFLNLILLMPHPLPESPILVRPPLVLGVERETVPPRILRTVYH